MNYWLLLSPVASAVTGWLVHKAAVMYILKKYWPQKQLQLSRAIAAWVSGNFSFKEIEQKIGDPSVLEKAMPVIEAHIDEFLNEKLQQEIPMLNMFVGTKTTDKIKSIFIVQLRQLFPAVMGQMAGDLSKNFNLSEKISGKLQEPNVRSAIKNQLSHQLKKLPVLGLIGGFITGLVSLLLIYLLK